MNSPKPQKYVEISILTQVYIDPEINNRELADTEEETLSLAKSIESTNGLLEPIVVYVSPPARKAQHGFDYELGSGYRRCAALKSLLESTDQTDWCEKVPAMVREDVPAADRHVHQLIENLQRKDLQPMEIALAFKKAIDDKDSKMSQKMLARAISWDESTVSTFLKVANHLSAEVQGKVMDGSLKWSSARELASVVAAHKISDAEQLELAAVGVGMDVAGFTSHLADLYKKADPANDEAAADPAVVSTGKEGVQRAYNTLRGAEIQKKYIPHLEEVKAKTADTSLKAKIDVYIDALKFVMQVDGTSIGAFLAPWEAELSEQAQELKNKENRDKQEVAYTRQAVSLIKKKLKEVPPALLPDGTPNPHREAPSLITILKGIRSAIEASLAKGVESKLDAGSMIEGFIVSNVDDFITKISNAYVEQVSKDKANAEEREKARDLKNAQEKEAAEAAEKGEVAAETAAV